MNIVTRVAPSPTGNLHFATARAALFNYLYAKQHGGKFLLRLEDTDKERSTNEFAEDIIDQLNWLGLTPDETHVQSEHIDTHKRELARLIAQGSAYISEEPSKNEDGTMVRVVRLRNPGTVITFTDLIRGDITTDTTELGDFVIARSTEDPLFHLAVVVDDHYMNVTHVIRGEDHISNTPRQILIAQALGYELPQYAHMPIILSPDGKGKMSKRKGDVAIASFRERGFLREAIINYIALLGWRKDGEQELFTITDLLNDFSLEGIQKNGAAHNEEKLVWLNKEYLRTQPDTLFLEKFETYVSTLKKNTLTDSVRTHIVPLLRERISVWEDIHTQLTSGEWEWLFDIPPYAPAQLVGKNGTNTIAQEHLEHVRTLLTDAPETSWTSTFLKGLIWPYAEEKGRGAVLWPLRFGLTGQEKSPDPFTVLETLGKTESLRRIAHAISTL